MGSPVRIIQEHPLASFLVGAFVISWIINALPVIIPGGESYVVIFGLLTAFGPAIAAIVVSAVCAPARVPSSPVLRWGSFAALFAALFLLFVFTATSIGLVAKMDTLAVVLGAILAALAAFTISSGFSGIQGVRTLMGSLFQWRAGARWYLAALFIYPAVNIVALAILLLGEGSPADIGASFRGISIPLLSLMVIAVLMDGPVGEEPGWRGFALPRLQFSYSPLVASLILAVIWAVWHAPLHFTGYYPEAAGFFPLFLRIVYELPVTVLYTWVYNHTRGSLLLATLLHASNDVTGVFIPVSAQVFYANPFFLTLLAVLFVVAAVIVIRDRMWERTNDPAITAPGPGAVA
ncbi:MAG: CPBP family intramembrane glutamic endopeptidase [Methanomicrobiales archaeon]